MKRLIALTLIFLPMVFLFQNCGSNGTETGNYTGSPAIGVGSSPNTLLLAMCTRLNQCYGTADFATCQTHLLPLTTIAGQIGLPSNYGSFQKIITDDAATTITANATNASTCIQEILALSCMSSNVTTSFSAASPTDFSNAANIIPTGAGSACPVFY